MTTRFPNPTAHYPYGGAIADGDPRVQRAETTNASGGLYPWNGTGPEDGDPIMTGNDAFAGRLRKPAPEYDDELDDDLSEEEHSTMGDGPENGDPAMTNNKKDVNVAEGKEHLATLGPGPENGDPKMNQRHKAGYNGKPHLVTMGPGPKKDRAMDRRSKATMANGRATSIAEESDQMYAYNRSPGPGSRDSQREMSTQNRVKNPKHANRYPYGTGKPVEEAEKHGHRKEFYMSKHAPGPDPDRQRKPEKYGVAPKPKENFPFNKQQGGHKIEEEGAGHSVHTPHARTGKDYANSMAGGWKRKNPAMDRRAKAKYVGGGSNYVYGHAGGWKKPNPAMKEAEAATMRRLNRLEEMKNKLQDKIQEVLEDRQTNLAFLIESAVDKAELVLAAKSITEKMQKMAQDLALVGPKELMPLVDNMKVAYGPEKAHRFNTVATKQLNMLTQVLAQAKDSIGTEIASLEGMVNGGPGNDMSGGMQDGMGGENDMGGLGAGMPDGMDDMGGEGGLGDEMGGGAMGGGAQMGGDDLGDLGGDGGLGGGGLGGGGAAGGGGGAGAGGGLNLDLGGGGGGGGGELGGGGMRGGSPAGRARKESFVNSNALKLVEAENPDRIVYEAFRRAFSESGKPVAAAQFVASTYDIDYSDVVQIVKEARAILAKGNNDAAEKRKSRTGRKITQANMGGRKRPVKEAAKQTGGTPNNRFTGPKGESEYNQKKKKEKDKVLRSKKGIGGEKVNEGIPDEDEEFNRVKAGSPALNARRRSQEEVLAARRRAEEEKARRGRPSKLAFGGGKVTRESADAEKAEPEAKARGSKKKA